MNQNLPIGFVFFSGWAMPPDFFVPLQAALLQHFPHAKTHHIQPGYFGDAQLGLPDWPHPIRWFGIGHSYGLMRLLCTPAPWQGIVSLCGFTHFQAHGEVAQTLRQGLLENCNTTLRRFYRLCALPGTLRPATVTHPHTLLADLDALLTCTAETLPATPLLALAATDDEVVPPDLTRECFAAPDIRWRDKTGHALGWFEPDWCAEQISTWLSQQPGQLPDSLSAQVNVA